MLQQGDIVITHLQSRKLKIGKPLHQGGQGSIFSVESQSLVVKMYHPSLLTTSQAGQQLSRLVNMVKEGTPSPAFIWPLDVVTRPGLGYVMPRVSSSHTSLLDLNWKGDCPSWGIFLRICYRMSQAFAALHLRRGYAYCDLSTANVMCDPKSGDVRIIDVDNLTVDGRANVLGIIGTPRYMAPELQRASVRDPCIETDLHSLAVIIFETLLFHHPFLGDRILEGPPHLEEKALGENPVYIYNPRDKSNRYKKYDKFGGLPPPTVPGRVQQLFTESFVDGVANPRLRVRETRWQRALADSLDNLVPCTNKKCLFQSSFLDGRTDISSCAYCGSPPKTFHVLKFYGQRSEVLRTKVVTGTEWLSAHHCKVDQALNFKPPMACAKAEVDPQYGVTLRNVARESFLYRAPGGTSFSAFPPGKRVVLRPGTRIQFGALGVEAEVVK